MSNNSESRLPALRRTLIGACALLVLPLGPALGQEEAHSRIEAITLSSGGLAEIRRGVAVEGSAALGFDVPLDQVDDILKSLLVRDPAGGVASMTLDGLSPVEETFRRLPFAPGDMNALPRLLRALQGVSVRAASGGRTVEGMVLGVEIAAEQNPDEAGPEPILSVMTGEGRIAVLRLRADTELDILDPAMRETLREAAAVSGRARMDETRTISIALEGGGARAVALDYVVAAPVWKTAYRLMLEPDDTARLQAWAVIENATGEDWREVAVTLSSGAPVTLAQRLHERYWHARPEVPVSAQTAAAPRPDRARGMALETAEPLMAADMAFERMAAPPLPAPAPSAPAEAAVAAEGETAALYRLPAPVDLPAGRTLSVPFIDAELSAERIALFQPERGDIHPISAIRLENTTEASLPPGIVTVYAPDGEGYAGDAQLAGLPAGESRMVSFTADRKVEVRTEPGREEALYRASLVEGVLRASRITRSATLYRVLGAGDGPRTVIVEHPRRPGWRFASDALFGETPTHHRLRVAVEPGGTAAIEAVSERTESQSIALVEADAETLLAWSGRIEDAATAATLADLAERRGEIARAERARAEIEREIERAAESQARIRENLAAVPGDSTLGQRYVAMLEEEEDRILELTERRRQAEERLAGLRADFDRFVAGL